MKDRSTRQQDLLRILDEANDPVTGTELATRLNVTRQVVVHDIALLRAQGIDLVSTPRGYIIAKREHGVKKALLAVCHPPELTGLELYTFADYGIVVLNVQIEHPVYGELTGSLHLSSRRDVDLFMAKMNSHGIPLLSSLTDGYHLHNVEYTDDSRLQEAIARLKEQGIRVFD